MTDAVPAKHAFLTNPERGETLLNIMVEGQEFQCFKISKDHLFDLNAKSADILLKEYK